MQSSRALKWERNNIIRISTKILVLCSTIDDEDRFAKIIRGWIKKGKKISMSCENLHVVIYYPEFYCGSDMYATYYIVLQSD